MNDEWAEETVQERAKWGMAVWNMMDESTREWLWKKNCESDHWSRTWTFGMFAASTSIRTLAIDREKANLRVWLKGCEPEAIDRRH
mgnify:CR=1 FL=1|jgi:hypothetical protein|tara:strand:- start:11430 stop:11687 length:258 start_codon:yes stop_codon:yes gene_type:complete